MPGFERIVSGQAQAPGSFERQRSRQAPDPTRTARTAVAAAPALVLELADQVVVEERHVERPDDRGGWHNRRDQTIASAEVYADLAEAC